MKDLASAFGRGTSPVDWCEANYRFSSIIAEFINTVTNLIFLILPPLLLKLFHNYAITINKGVYIVWTLFAVVGLSSMYFHATLSLMGQLLDELSILWLIAACFGMWVPRRHYPSWLKGDRRRFQFCMMAMSAILTMGAWIYPWINAFALMCLGIPAFYFLLDELRICRNERVRRLGLRCGLTWLFSLGFWLSDRIFCDLWSALDFPYLHGAWHISIALTAYSICVLFAWFDAYHEHPELNPMLKYWPRDDFELAVPYVELKNALS